MAYILAYIVSFFLLALGNGRCFSRIFISRFHVTTQLKRLEHAMDKKKKICCGLIFCLQNSIPTPSKYTSPKESYQLQVKSLVTHTLGSNKRQHCIVCLQPSQVYNGFDEDGVIAYVGIFRVQLGERTEEWAAAGNVHITDWPLKGRGGDIGPESIDYVFPVVLVEQHQGDLGTDVRSLTLHLLRRKHMKLTSCMHEIHSVAR